MDELTVDYAPSCPRIPVLLVGSGPLAQTLGALLVESGHPVEVGLRPPSAVSDDPAVVLMLCRDVSDGCALADEFHGRWPRAAVILVSDHISIEFEDQVGIREFATLRLKSSNGQEFHALVHDVLKPVPSTTPEALRPRTTDHPPSSR